MLTFRTLLCKKARFIRLTYYLPYILDILDMKILSRLLNNCRKPDRQIGMELGISGGAVGSRINKMEKLGIIEKFCLKVEPPLLGLNMFYIVVNSQNQKEIIKNVKLAGMPFAIVPCVGGITVIGVIVKEDMQQKIELLQKLMEDVRVMSVFEADNTKITHNLTRTDLEILNQLIEDPRKKIDQFKATNRRPINYEFVRSIFMRDHPGTTDEKVIDAFSEYVCSLDDSIPNGTYVDMCENLPIVNPLNLTMPVLVMRGEWDGIASLDDLLNFFRILIVKFVTFC